MRKLKANIPPLVIIFVSIILVAIYFRFIQKHQIDPFVQQINSLNVNRNNPIELKDYVAFQRDLITLQNTLNSSIFQLISGLFFFCTAYTAWRNLVVSEKKQVAERFAKAVDQLGSDKLEVRVGGIFSLEQIAQNYPEEHWTVIEVLTSYVRDQSIKGQSVFKPKSESRENQSEINSPSNILRYEDKTSVTTDIQAALTVIYRRDHKQDPKDRVIDLSFCDLRGAVLKNANLTYVNLRESTISNANLENVNLSYANLDGADFTSSNLKRATLYKSSLQHALLNNVDLEQANLQKSDLTDAKLEAANLKSANLKSAKLYSTSLKKAKLEGANLSQADLKLTNLADAIIDEKTTKLDKKWKRIYEINISGGKGAKFDEFDFNEAVLMSVDFEEASLKKATFNGAILIKANFKKANLEGASFCTTRVLTNLEKANLEGANLKGAVFEIAKLEDAIFEGANLENAKFIESNLENTNFSKANLKNAEFEDCCCYSESTSFKEADLEKARFTGSLGRANFQDVKNHQNADFKDADISEISCSSTIE